MALYRYGLFMEMLVVTPWPLSDSIIRGIRGILNRFINQIVEALWYFEPVYNETTSVVTMEGISRTGGVEGPNHITLTS